MNRREAVVKALMHEKTDRIPYHFEFTTQSSERMMSYTGDKDFAKPYEGFLHYGQYWGYPTERTDKKEHYKDDFGVTWNRSGADKDIGVIDEPIIPEPDISYYKEPYLNEKRIREECERLIATKEDKFCFVGIGFSVFERLWSYVGMENALIYMLTDPEFVHELLDKIVEFNLRVIDIFCEYPFDAVYFGDDWGQQKGMIMGPVLWREFIKPRVKRMYERVKENGKFVLQHSCGDIEEVFPDLIEIGLDCYQTVQPEIYDLEKIKREYGSRLAFWGCISTQRDLPSKTPEEICGIISDTVGIMSDDGGFILAPTHAIPQDVPEENIIAMMKAFKKIS